MGTADQREPSYKVVIEKDQMMRARDGVGLRADVYRPDAPGRFPVLLVRTPYDKSAGMALTEKDYFPPRGYVLVVQDTRGRFSSEGEFYPFIHEANVLDAPARELSDAATSRPMPAPKLVSHTTGSKLLATAAD